MKSVDNGQSEPGQEGRRKAFRPRWDLLAIALVVVLLSAAEARHVYKDLPEGLSHAGDLRPATDVRFFSDVTYVDDAGDQYVSQEIFDEIIYMVNRAERLVVIDMFLFNEFQRSKREGTRELSSKLVDVIVYRRLMNPLLRVVVITDPINTVYRGTRSYNFERLRAAGAEVVTTDLKPLRDSNPIYSALWRPTFGLFKNDIHSGRLKNPLGGNRKVTFRSYMEMLNFKANHRKVVLADDVNVPGGWTALVTSANPHDGSSAHGNVAVKFNGPAVADILKSELAVMAFSRGRDIHIPVEPPEVQSPVGVAVLTESAIKDALLESIYKAGKDDLLMVSVFYLSDRDVVWALKEVASVGAQVRVLLDPNFDDFGYSMKGIPNRPVGMELNSNGVAVRWCDTHGEQCNANMLLADYADGTSRLLAGSASFTRRNLQDLNLETDVLVEGPSSEGVFVQARSYFGFVWDNRPGLISSVPFEKYAEKSNLKDYLYRVMEFTGLSIF